MIICFNEKINSFSEINIKNQTLNQEYIQELMPSCTEVSCNCPKCKAKSNFSFHGCYMRNVTFIHENSSYNFRIAVTRVICNSCGCTHSLLPNFIIPYKIHSRDSILYVVSQAQSSSISETSEKLNISFQLIYAFTNLVLSFYNHIDSINRERSLYNNLTRTYYILNCIKICDINLNIFFFNRYNWILFMNKFQNEKSPPLTIGLSLIVST